MRAELDDLGDRHGRGELSATPAARAEPAILAPAPARQAELSTPEVLPARWPDVLGELRDTRSPSRGPQRAGR